MSQNGHGGSGGGGGWGGEWRDVDPSATWCAIWELPMGVNLTWYTKSGLSFLFFDIRLNMTVGAPACQHTMRHICALGVLLSDVCTAHTITRQRPWNAFGHFSWNSDGSPHGYLAFMLNATVSFSSRGVSLSRTFWLVVPRTPFLLSVVAACMGNFDKLAWFHNIPGSPKPTPVTVCE